MTKILYSNLESSTRFSSARYSSSKLIVIHAYVHVFCRLAEAPTTQTASCIRQLLNVYAAQPAASAPAADELPGVEDTISTKILRRMHGAVLDKMSPRSTVADGNCAYRAVSLALYGTQDLHIYIRLMAAVEILSNQELYDASSPSFAITDTRIMTSDYQTVVEHAVTDGRYVELIHLYAISSAFNVAIQSYMPPPAALGTSQSPYTVLITGRACSMIDPAFTLMWTSASDLSSSLPLEMSVNHIVLLAKRVDRTAATDRSINVSLVDDATFDYSKNSTALDTVQGKSANALYFDGVFYTIHEKNFLIKIQQTHKKRLAENYAR